MVGSERTVHHVEGSVGITFVRRCRLSVEEQHAAPSAGADDRAV